MGTSNGRYGQIKQNLEKQQHQLCKHIQVEHISFVASILLYGCNCKTWTLLNLRNGSRLSRPSAWENFSTYSTWSTRPTTGWGARLTYLWVHRNLFWKLLRDRNLHEFGMSCTTTASPKPIFSTPWRAGVTMVSRGNAGVVIPAHARFAYKQQWPPAEKTGRGSLLNCTSCNPDYPISQGTELNWKFKIALSISVWKTIPVIYCPSRKCVSSCVLGYKTVQPSKQSPSRT